MPAVLPVRGTDPLRNFKYLVYINKPTVNGDNLGRLGFSSVTGLSAQTQPITYREGGDNTVPRKMPGQTDFPPITFRRGLVALDSYMSWYWMKEIFFAVTGNPNTGGTLGNNFRCSILIDVLAHPVTQGPQGAGVTIANGALPPVMVSFNIFNAWIDQLSYSDLDAGGNGIMLDQLEVVHEGFDIKWAQGMSPRPIDPFLS